MESKICSYTEKNVRIQLVRIQDGPELVIELRYNRRVIGRFSRSQGMLARYQFSHIVHEFVVLRDSSILSKLTT